MLNTFWVKNNNTYRKVTGDSCESLPIGIYTLNFIDQIGWILEYSDEKFTFNYKLYDIQKEFLDYTYKTIKNTSSNLGILFNGIKGTGKSVTAKVLANQLNYPVIIIKSFDTLNNSMIEYLNSLNFDCVLFMDEYEKQFDEDDNTFLSLMDGAYTSPYRRIFLLTTNDLGINENMLSRPSRIRYIKEFGNLEKEVIMNYFDDNLQDKSAADTLFEFLDSLEISTMDILKTVTEEVNIHGIHEFMKHHECFNVAKQDFNYFCYYATAYKNYVLSTNYNIDTFLKCVNKHKSAWVGCDGYLIDDNEDSDTSKLPYVEFTSVHSDVNVNNLKVDDYFLDTKVVQIDISRHVIVCEKDKRYFFYYIDNPDETPSLFNKKKHSRVF